MSIVRTFAKTVRVLSPLSHNILKDPALVSSKDFKHSYGTFSTDEKLTIAEIVKKYQPEGPYVSQQKKVYKPANKNQQVEELLIEEAKEMCTKTLTNCNKLYTLIRELEARNQPEKPKQFVAFARKRLPASSYSQFSAKYSTSSQDGEDEENNKFVKSSKDFCKEYDHSSKMSNRKRCSYYKPKTEVPPPPPPKEVAIEDDCIEECGDEYYDEELLEELLELPDVFEEFQGMLRAKDDSVDNYFGQVYKNKVFYMFHNHTFYDFIAELKKHRSAEYCTTQGQDSEVKCVVICEKQVPMAVVSNKLPDVPKPPEVSKQPESKKSDAPLKVIKGNLSNQRKPGRRGPVDPKKGGGSTNKK